MRRAHGLRLDCLQTKIQPKKQVSEPTQCRGHRDEDFPDSSGIVSINAKISLPHYSELRSLSDKVQTRVIYSVYKRHLNQNTCPLLNQNVPYVKPKHVPYIKPKHVFYVKPKHVPYVKPKHVPYVKPKSVSYVNPAQQTKDKGYFPGRFLKDIGNKK